MEDAKFIGLTLPRTIIASPTVKIRRAPIISASPRMSPGPTTASISGAMPPSPSAASCFAAFADFGWMADIRGFKHATTRAAASSATFPNPPSAWNRTTPAHKFSTEVLISDIMEKELESLGFIPLSHCQYTNDSVFFSNYSVSRPKASYNDNLASVQFPHLQHAPIRLLRLAASAITSKVQASRPHRRLPGCAEGSGLADQLAQSIHRGCQQHRSARSSPNSPCARPPSPSRKVPGKPGVFKCVIQLSPHYQMDALSGGFETHH